MCLIPESIPLRLDELKLFKYDLFDFAFISASHIVAVSLFDGKVFSVEPILALHIAFSAVQVNRFVSFVRIEEKTPA